jgi:hypothetical protein
VDERQPLVDTPAEPAHERLGREGRAGGGAHYDGLGRERRLQPGRGYATAGGSNGDSGQAGCEQRAQAEGKQVNRVVLAERGIGARVAV